MPVILFLVAPNLLAAQAELTYQKEASGNYHYTVFLQDNGSTPVGTFWYAWVPGQDFMPSAPSNIISPAGWSDIVTGGGTGDGFAIQWRTSTPISPGTNLTGFQFDSSSTPSQLQGDAPTAPGTPVGTSFVYQGAPFSDAGVQFVASPVQHPWTDPANNLDVNADGLVSPLDALQILNVLNTTGPAQLTIPPPAPTTGSFSYVDTNGDGSISPIDALLILNALNAASQSQAAPLAELARESINTVPEPSAEILALLGLAGWVAIAGWDRTRGRRLRSSALVAV